MNQSATASSSSHTEILPHQDESQDFRALSPLESDGVNREEEAEGVAESENQLGDTIPLEHSESMEMIPLTLEGNNISPNQDMNV